MRIVFICLISLLFTSCSVKYNNKDFGKFVKKEFDDNETSKNYLRGSIKEKISTKDVLEFGIKTKLSTVLKKLSKIDGKIYMLKGKDITIEPVHNSQKLKINNFYKLNQFLNDTTNFTMVISKNRFLKNRIKIVELKDLKSLSTDLNNIPFEIVGSRVIIDVLKEISKISNFNMIYKNPSKNDSSSISGNKKSDFEKIFSNKFITYQGDNVANFLNLVAQEFNLFLNIDYKNRLIIFSSLKNKIFHITVNNIQLSGNLEGEKSSSLGGSSSSLPIKSSIALNLLTDLETSLKAVSSNSNVKINFNKSSGQLFVQADRNSMEMVSKIVDDFNNIFNKQINFELSIYQFAVTKDFNIGSLLSTDIKKIDGRNVDVTAQSNTSFVDSLATLIYSRGANKLTINGKSNTHNVRLMKVDNHGYILKNNIPYAIDLTDTKSYVKTVTVTTNTTQTGTLQTVQPETETISEGIVLTVLPRVSGNRVELNIEPTIMSIDRIQEKAFGENTITLPEVSINKFKSNVNLDNKEKRIIGYLTKYQDVKDYNGIVPIDDFIIGGESDRQFARTELVFVVSVNIEK